MFVLSEARDTVYDHSHREENPLNEPSVPTSARQGTVDPTLGVAVERQLYGGRWVTSGVACLPITENADGLRV